MIPEHLYRRAIGRIRARIDWYSDRSHVMDFSQMPYVHLLLFRCGRCGQQLVITVPNGAANLEEVDGDSYRVECQCGWFEHLLGVEAAKHWVTPSHDQQHIIIYFAGDPDERLSHSP